MKIFAEQFDQLYIEYFARLFRFAREYLFSDEEAKNLVQEVFLTIWEKREQIDITGSPLSYLLTLTKNRAIDQLRHQRVKNRFREEVAFNIAALEVLNTAFAEEPDIEKTLLDAIEKLPPKCLEIFRLSKFENKKYAEIASILNISVNTVESQMQIALKKIRNYLKIS